MFIKILSITDVWCECTRWRECVSCFLRNFSRQDIEAEREFTERFEARLTNFDLYGNYNDKNQLLTQPEDESPTELSVEIQPKQKPLTEDEQAEWEKENRTQQKQKSMGKRMKRDVRRGVQMTVTCYLSSKRLRSEHEGVVESEQQEKGRVRAKHDENAT